jgi:hypothetical protein
MTKTLEQRVEHFKRCDLKSLLDQCTRSQRSFFNHIYPDGVLESSLDSAIKLCERTIHRNNHVDAIRLLHELCDNEVYNKYSDAIRQGIAAIEIVEENKLKEKEKRGHGPSRLILGDEE